jgi:hypothetical protein
MSLFRLLGFSISNHSSHLGTQISVVARLQKIISNTGSSFKYVAIHTIRLLSKEILLGNTQRLSRSAFPTGFPYIKRCLKERLVCRMLKDLQGQQEAKEPAIDDSALSDMLVGVIRARNKAALDSLKLLFPCS